MLSVVTINRLRLVSLVTTKHILIDFSINGLFDRHLLCLFCLTQRRINNNHPKNIQKYINTMYNYSQKLILLKQACECQHKLYFSSKKAESIDETLTAVRLAVEKKCHVSHYLPWDKETNTIMTLYNIVWSHLSCLKCNKPLPSTLAMKMSKFNEPFDVASTLEDTQKLRDKLYKQQRNLILSPPFEPSNELQGKKRSIHIIV